MTVPERPPLRPLGGRPGLLRLAVAGLLLVIGAAPPPAAAIPSDRAGAAAPGTAGGAAGAGPEAARARLAAAAERLRQHRVAGDLAAGRLSTIDAEVAALEAAWRETGAALRRQRDEVAALDRRLAMLAARRAAAEADGRRLRALAGYALAELTLASHRAAESPDPRAIARLRALGATLLDGWREREMAAATLRRRVDALAGRRAEAVAGMAAALSRADGLRDRLADRTRQRLLVRASAAEAAGRAEAAAAEVRALRAELGRPQPPGPSPTVAVAAVGGEAGVRAAAGPMDPLLPVAGPVVARFGQPAVGPLGQGVVIRAAPGQPVGAPADGRIVFAGRFRSYGLLLIIDHGDGYHSLLSGMSRFRVGVNQWVRAGEPVGSFDDLGEIGPQLYVELRRNGRPVNPLPWLAASDSKVRG